MRIMFSVMAFAFLFVIFSLSGIEIQAQVSDQKMFSIQSNKIRRSLLLVSYGDSITGYRDEEKIKSNLNQFSIFLQTNVSIEKMSDGAIQVFPYDTNTWFIPIYIGGNPFKIAEGYCIRFFCIVNRNKDCPACEIIDLMDRLTANNGVDAICMDSYWIGTSYAACDSFLPYDYLGAGVIVHAKQVEIKDPDWYISCPAAEPLIFQIDDRGNIFKYEKKKIKK